MNDADTRRYEAFLRSQELRRTLGARIPADSLAAELFDRMTHIVSNIDVQTAEQSSGRRAAQESTASKASTRDELWRDLEAIRRTARSMALTVPGLEDKFRLPYRLKDQDLLAIARAFHADATPLRPEFIRRGLPADFLEDLADDIAAFEQAITRHIQGTERHVAASAAIDDLMDDGINTLRELDPIMRNLFAEDPAVLAQWLSASHVERPPRRKKQPPK